MERCTPCFFEQFSIRRGDKNANHGYALIFKPPPCYPAFNSPWLCMPVPNTILSTTQFLPYLAESVIVPCWKLPGIMARNLYTCWTWPICIIKCHCRTIAQIVFN